MWRQIKPFVLCKNQIILLPSLKLAFPSGLCKTLGTHLNTRGPFPARKCNIPVFYRQGFFIAPPTQTERGREEKCRVAIRTNTHILFPFIFVCACAHSAFGAFVQASVHAWISLLFFFFQPWKGKSRYLHHKTNPPPIPDFTALLIR